MIKKAIVHALGSVSYAIAQWLIVTFTVRFVSLEAAGLYAFYLAIFNPAAVFLGFGLRNSIASDGNYKFSSDEYSKARLAGVLLLFPVVFGVFALGGEGALVAGAVFFIKLIELYVDPVYGEWIRNGRAERFGLSKIFRLALFLPIFFGLYYALGADIKVLYAYPLASLIVAIAYDCRHSNLSFQFKLSRWEGVYDLIRFSAPLAIGSFVISLTSSAPRVAIGQIVDNSAVATYVLLLYFVSLSSIPLQSFAQTVIPQFSKFTTYKSLLSSKSFLLQLSITLFLGFAFLVVMALIGSDLVLLLYNLSEEFPDRDYFIVGLSGLLQYLLILQNSIFVSARQFGILAKAASLGLITILIVVYPLIYLFGLTGGYVAYFLSQLLTFGFLLAKILKG